MACYYILPLLKKWLERNQKSEGSSLRSVRPAASPQAQRLSPSPELRAPRGTGITATPSSPSRGRKVVSPPNCATPAPLLLKQSCWNRDSGRGRIAQVFIPGREENFPFTLVGANLDLHWRPGHRVQSLIRSIFPEGDMDV